MIVLLILFYSCFNYNINYKNKFLPDEINQVSEEIKKKNKEELNKFEILDKPVGIYAVLNNAYDLIELLLSKEYNFDAPDKEGNTALMLACQKNDKKSFDILIEKTDINLENTKFKNALYFAVNSGNPYFVKSLLNREININDQSSNLINLCLMSLASHNQQDIDNYYECAKLLLEENVDTKKMSITKNSFLQSFVLLAITKDDKDSLQFLQKNGIDIDEYDPSYDEETQGSD